MTKLFITPAEMNSLNFRLLFISPPRKQKTPQTASFQWLWMPVHDLSSLVNRWSFVLRFRDESFFTSLCTSSYCTWWCGICTPAVERVRGFYLTWNFAVLRLEKTMVKFSMLQFVSPSTFSGSMESHKFSISKSNSFDVEQDSRASRNVRLEYFPSSVALS